MDIAIARDWEDDCFLLSAKLARGAVVGSSRGEGLHYRVEQSSKLVHLTSPSPYW
jgi:hypothetical protein